MGAVAGGASVASAGLSLAGRIMQGEGTQAADNYQSDVLAEKARLGRTAATETNADMVAKLNRDLGNIDAVRAASGDSPTSPTGLALRDVTSQRENQERAIRVGNILTQSEMDDSSAAYLRSAGSFALTQGVISGLAGAAGQIGKTNPGTFG